MLAAQRREELLKRIGRDGQVAVGPLSREWGVSEDTIRRDLDDLAASGLVKRVHGGAVPAGPALGDYRVRETLSPDEKQRVGQAAAALVRPGQVVLVDGGTTTRALVRSLARDLEATLVTHSPTIAAELIDHRGIEVILLGGRLFRHSMVALGPTVHEALDRLRPDLCFLGATGIHPEGGVTTGDWEEAAVKRKMAQVSAMTYVLGTPEKLGAVGPHRILALGEIQGIVVPEATEGVTLAWLRAAGLQIVLAGSGAPDPLG